MIKSLLSRIFNYKFHVRGLLNPFLGLQISSLGDYSGTNLTKRECPIIVSLTSYRERFKDLPITLYSLLNQSLKPDRVILWLDKEYEDLNNIPYEITQFLKNGLEICFVEDLRSYTKIIYALEEFRDSIIVTADDDIYYSTNWLKKLYYSYVSNPQDIHVHRAHKVLVSGGEILPYEKWQKHVEEENASYANFLTGVGGVLYPPKCFTSEVLRRDIFLKYAPYADDIWLWVMALVHNRKIRVVKNHIRTLIAVNIYKQIFSKTLYSKNRHGGNDKQLKALMKFYRENVLKKLQ